MTNEIIRRSGNVNTLVDVMRPPNLPEEAFLSLVKEIKEFETTLSNEEAVGSLLASFGQSVHLQIRTVKRAGQFICMAGTLADGSEASLVQHFTQVSILLTKVKIQPEAKKASIGFL